MTEQSLLCRPAKFEYALVDSLIRKINALAPFLQCKSLALKSEQKIRGHIAHLLGIGCPSAVARFVVSLVVYAINAVSFRAFSHVFKKETVVIPAITDRNPFSAVFLIGRRCFVEASFSHSLPDSIGSAFVSHAMSGRKSLNLLRGYFGFQAAARFTDSTSELILSYLSLCAAITPAKVKGFPAAHSRKTKNSPSVVFGADHFRRPLVEVNNLVSLTEKG